MRAGLHVIPGHHGIASSQSGGVQLKDGGDIHPIGDRDQRVHDFLLWSPETASKSLVICIQLKEKKCSEGAEKLQRGRQETYQQLLILYGENVRRFLF